MNNENNWFLSKAITIGDIDDSIQVQMYIGGQKIWKNCNGLELAFRAGNLKIKLKLHVGSSDIQAKQVCLPPSAMGIRKIQSNGTYPAVFRGRYDD